MKPNYKQIQEMKRKYRNNVTLHLNKCSIVKTCSYCHKLYVPTHHKQKFCSDICYREHRKDYKAEWKRTKYKPKPQIGTGHITGHRNEDFDREAEIVRKELRRFRK